MAAPNNYSNLQIALHWIIASLIVFQLVVNEPMQDAFRNRLADKPTEAMAGATLHAVIGLIILGLAILRAFVRYRRGVPLGDEDVPKFFIWLGHIAHMLLYGFLFFMPITGAIAWFGGVELSGVAHELGRLILVPAILIHVAGAMVEHFVFRSDSLRRMLKLGAKGSDDGSGEHGIPGTN